MRRVRNILLTALAVLAAAASHVSAQIIPWSAPPEFSDVEVRPVRGPKMAVRRDHRSAALAKQIDPTRVSASPNDEAIVHALSEPPSSVVLSSFGPDVGSGAVRAGTSWVGNVQQNAGSITVAGTAKDDNGWGASDLSLNATGMNSLVITAQRDAGNEAAALYIQFEDQALRTQVFSVSTSQFALGVPTTVHIPIGSWTINFGSHDIASWSIGGGGVGYGLTAVPLRMTFDSLSFSTSAIPEPSTYATVLALVALAVAAWRRRAGGSGGGPKRTRPAG